MQRIQGHPQRSRSRKYVQYHPLYEKILLYSFVIFRDLFCAAPESRRVMERDSSAGVLLIF